MTEANAGMASSWVGCSRSGRNRAYVGSFWIIGVATVVGCTVLTRIRCCGQLAGCGAHQADDAVLGRDVVGAVWDLLQARGRAGQDHRPAVARGDHGRGHGLDRVPDALEADVLHVVPLRLGQLPEGGVGEDAGVRGDDVDVPEVLQRRRDELVDVVLAADVPRRRDDPPVERLDLADRLLQVARRGHLVDRGVDLADDVDGDDVGALLGHPHGVGPALTACRAGDERDLAVQPAHVRAPLEKGIGIRTP